MIRYSLTEKRHFVLSVLITAVLLGLFGCQSSGFSKPSPQDTARDIFKAMFSGQAKRALDFVCIDKTSGIVFMVAVEVDWKNDEYDILSNDGNTAIILVKGRVVAAADDVQSIFGQMNEQLPRVGVGAQINMYFDKLKIINDGGRWCVPEESIKEFWQYLIDIMNQELGSP